MNLEKFGLGRDPIPVSPWIRASAVLAFCFIAYQSAIDILQGGLYSLFPLLITMALVFYFGVGRSLKPQLSIMIKYGGISAILGCMVVGLTWVLCGWLIFGEFFVSIVMLPMVLFASLLPALVFALPMMALRWSLDEPYYFLLFSSCGFIFGIFVSLVFFNGNPMDATAYVGWKLFGGLGIAYSITSWKVLKSTEREWFATT